MRRGAPPKDVNAPSPAPPTIGGRGRGAHDTDDGAPSTSSAISVAQTGTPRTKFFVPSIGSTTHCRPASRCAAELLTDTESSGRRAVSEERTALRPTGRRR